MGRLNQLIYGTSVLFVFGFLAGNGLFASGQHVDEVCLGCICEASSSCNASTACHVPYQGAYFCGPFLISYAYWQDAGKVVLSGDSPDRKGAFEACTLDMQCAAEVVRNYMKAFAQDCNGDGKVSCADYMLIHKLGGYGCTGQLGQSDYAVQYQTCSSHFKID